MATSAQTSKWAVVAGCQLGGLKANNDWWCPATQRQCGKCCWWVHCCCSTLSGIPDVLVCHWLELSARGAGLLRQLLAPLPNTRFCVCVTPTKLRSHCNRCCCCTPPCLLQTPESASLAAGTPSLAVLDGIPGAVLNYVAVQCKNLPVVAWVIFREVIGHWLKTSSSKLLQLLRTA